MAKQGSVHPGYQVITLVYTDGTREQVKSTYKFNDRKNGGEAPVLTLEIDRLTHPAFNDAIKNAVISADKVDTFRKRFQGVDFLNIK